ncbi:MAG: GNAT family N-acetyltransferase [Marinifilaceae bacterium]|jgi:ribosomal protein S18 acetylase RimI-like enzyme|nr:GNAT family N-acetyltransferase [Marinifilaceae bacterium]
MIEIESLLETSSDDIYTAFSEAFIDYDVQLDREGFDKMLKRRGFRKEISFGAFDDGRLIAFTLNGLGLYNGKKTAYDTGTGTIKEYRGKGLAKSIFEYSLPEMKKAKVEQYLLEVLQHNEKAISVYKKLGFVVTREFNYFVKPISEIVNEVNIRADLALHIVDLPEDNMLDSFIDFTPSWQNNNNAIRRSIHDFKVICASHIYQVIGILIFEPKTGDITQISVDKKFRRYGVASAMLRKMLEMNETDSIKLINSELNCESINGFMKSKGIEPTGKQFEMKLEI